jgi:hypothetical protein
MFADKGYEGWDNLSSYEKVERMMAIHKSGHEGEDVSFQIISSCHSLSMSLRFP